MTSLTTNLNLHFVAFGGAGCNVAEQLYRQGLPGRYTCISHPVRKYQHQDIDFIHFIPPGEKFTCNGVEIFLKPPMQAPLAIPPSVDRIFDTPAVFILLAGLGGFTGTRLMEHFALLLHQRNVPFRAIATFPFRFEGKKRADIALETIKKLNHIHNFHYLQLDTIAPPDSEIPVSLAFAMVDARMSEIAIAG